MSLTIPALQVGIRRGVEISAQALVYEYNNRAWRHISLHDVTTWNGMEASIGCEALKMDKEGFQFEASHSEKVHVLVDHKSVAIASSDKQKLIYQKALKTLDLDSLTFTENDQRYVISGKYRESLPRPKLHFRTMELAAKVFVAVDPKARVYDSSTRNWTPVTEKDCQELNAMEAPWYANDCGTEQNVADFFQIVARSSGRIKVIVDNQNVFIGVFAKQQVHLRNPGFCKKDDTISTVNVVHAFDYYLIVGKITSRSADK